MNKALKKYGKTKWAKTRLSKSFKSRQSYKALQAYLIACQGASMVRQIAYTSVSDKSSIIEKKISMVECIHKTVISINKALS